MPSVKRKNEARTSTGASTKADDDSLTLLMLVTNRDCVIADYSIRKYQKLWALTRSFRLHVYANCLSLANKERYFARWNSYAYVRLVDNEAHGSIVRRKGDRFTTPEGITLRYDDDCEHYDEVWTREQRRCKTPFFGTVDADFEVLSAGFFLTMFRRLQTEDTLAGISTDYSATAPAVFDTYSGETIMLHERWHTWCCIYRSTIAPYLDEVSSFYYERRLPNGGRHAFDSYSHFQHLLTTKYGFRFAALDRSFQRQFIHYGSFSKNKSITSANIPLYRWLSIAAKTGLGVTPNVINRAIRGSARLIFKSLFARAVKERATFDY